MTGKFETKEEIIKWKYHGKIGAKSENDFKKKSKKRNSDKEGTIWRSGEEVEEEKKYLEGPIKIKITAENDFYSSFFKLSGCVPIDVQVYFKRHFPKTEVEKEDSFKFFLKKCGLNAKVYMNTFYGKAENSKSSIFLRELAGRITSAGKYNLNLVTEFVTKKGFRIKYGDTDSLYFTCPEKYFRKCDEAFSGKNFLRKRTELKWLKLL
ncbi:hypothetical protein C1646_665735 [Rhizophagus diaphanus]|nr:hypothetical protein C1646_665735 [Rhizophagus diaphanus] [Rhizophagus sp. MUCL 43196]